MKKLPSPMSERMRLISAAALLVFGAAMTAGNASADSADEIRAVDQDVQSLKKDLIALNRDLFKLEEELLYPASTQVAVFLSVDVGTYFALDSVTIKVDDKEVANYLYTEREVEALHRGGVQRLFLGNLKNGEHELVAFFTGKGLTVPRPRKSKADCRSSACARLLMQYSLRLQWPWVCMLGCRPLA